MEIVELHHNVDNTPDTAQQAQSLAEWQAAEIAKINALRQAQDEARVTLETIRADARLRASILNQEAEAQYHNAVADAREELDSRIANIEADMKQELAGAQQVWLVAVGAVDDAWEAYRKTLSERVVAIGGIVLE